jgi:hypothetical protein
MAKEKRTRKTRELSEEQKVEIAALRDKMREIREEGSFLAAYRKIRKESATIGKDKSMTEKEKKDALFDLCTTVSEMVE